MGIFRRMCCQQLEAFGQPLVAREKPAPEPQGSEVLLRVVAAGVCHSDVHICEGFYDLGGGRKSSFQGHVSLPLTPGHENSGVVVALGPEAKGVSEGELCLVCPWIGCGECPECREGAEHLCRAPRFLGANRDGGFADHVLVPDARYLIPLGDLDPVRAAPLACSGLTTFSALRKFGPRLAEQPLVVIGAGGLGLMCLAMLQLLGARPPVIVETDPGRCEAALAAGAVAAIDPKAPDVSKAIRRAVGGDVLCVLDLVGSGETTTLGFNLLGKRGKLVVVGLFGGAATISTPMLPMKSASIEGSYIGTLAELRELVGLVRQKGLPQVPLDRRPLEAANQALADLAQGRVVGRVVLSPTSA